jgi:adenine-specific DNA glycosylase
LKREIWCTLERRNGHVRMVKRPPQASLMAGMWELPQWADLRDESAISAAISAKWRTFRHSITVTDYTVHVLRDGGTRRAAQDQRGGTGRGKWIAIETIPELPITGLTRKILKAGGII